MESKSLSVTSTADWVFQRLKLFATEKGKTTAQIFADDGSSWTFEQLFLNSIHVAAGLESVGIHPGDVASVVARNTHELYAVVIGCVMSGVTIAPSIPELHPDELQQNFTMVNPKTVLAGAPYIPGVKQALQGFNPAPKVFEVQQLFCDCVAKGLRHKVDSNTFKPPYTNETEKHLIACMFSSGTTGKPKAVELTGYGLLQTVHLASQFEIPGTNGIACNSSQMNWVSWWYFLFRGLFMGWTRIFMDEGSPVSILEATRKFKPSILVGSPLNAGGIVNQLDSNPGQWDLSSVRAFFMGGDICNKVTHENLVKKLGVPVYQEYGSTEAGVVLQSRVGFPIVYGSSGRPQKPLKLVDLTTGEEITEPHRCGEILMKFPVFRKYVNNPEATAAAFDEHGWFKMGDVAYFDEMGNYFIVDRVKEMFKYCGYQIAPSELEDIIKKIPGVKDAGVVGKFGGLDIGYIPTAFVVKFPESNITEKNIHNFLAKFNLHDSKKLRGGVIFRDEIPRNANGKMLRGKLRALFNESQT